jgi:2,3-bisphosphoglycerate-independent phosphoglycerate mutase
MLDPVTGNPHTAHTTSESQSPPFSLRPEADSTDPVPFIVTGDKGGLTVTGEPGTLADVAPTVLEIMGLPQPEGKSLILSI